MAIILRQETDARATTKGTSLTFQELDNNFIELLDRVDPANSIVAGSNITISQPDSAGAITISASAGATADFSEGVIAGTNITINSESTGQVTVNLAETPAFSSYTETVNNITTDSAGTINVDPKDGPIQEILLTENVTFTGFQNAADGQSVTLILRQDGTGNRTFTESLDSAGRMLFAGGESTLSTAGDSVDIMSIVYANGIYYASLSTNFS
jgi:hypothetical protein